MMIEIEFTEEEIQEIRYERYHHPHPRVQQRMEVLLLKAKGLQHQQITEIAGICENTLRGYLRLYQQGGIEALKEFNWRKNVSEMAKHQEKIETHFREHPPATIAQAAAEIEEMTGIKRSETQVSVFLHHLGLKRRKTYSIPAKFDADQQETFKKTN